VLSLAGSSRLAASSELDRACTGTVGDMMEMRHS
jgi:hypothetical protein